MVVLTQYVYNVYWSNTQWTDKTTIKIQQIIPEIFTSDPGQKNVNGFFPCFLAVFQISRKNISFISCLTGCILFSTKFNQLSIYVQ